MRFSKKSVLITGGTSGLGAASALLFAKEGAKVAICSRDEDPGLEIVSKIEKNGGEGFFFLCDVRSPDEIENFVSEAIGKHGGLDIAVNCAGRNNPPNRLADIPLEEFQGVLETNLFGVYFGMRAEIPELLKTRGVIINVASILSAKPSGWMAAYSTSKTAVVALSQSAAEDYRDQGLRIYSFSPGPMATPMFEQALEDIAGDQTKYAGGFPKRGPMDPLKGAEAILDLADPKTGPDTGTNFILG